MAIFHWSVDICRRSKGHSVAGFSAYRAAEKLRNNYDGEVFDYRWKKEHLMYKEIMLPENAPDGFHDRSTLWNSVEEVEKSSKAQLARSIDIALHRELSLEENKNLLRGYLEANFVKDGMCVDFVIHDKGDGNPHAHALLSMRSLDENGNWMNKKYRKYHLNEDGKKILNAKGNDFLFDTINVNDWDNKDNVERWRKAWARASNDRFRELGLDITIDHRSHERRGIEKLPGIHIGLTASSMEKEDKWTDRGDIQKEIDAYNHNQELIKDLQRAWTEINKEYTINSRLARDSGGHERTKLDMKKKTSSVQMILNEDQEKDSGITYKDAGDSDERSSREKNKELSIKSIDNQSKIGENEQNKSIGETNSVDLGGGGESQISGQEFISGTLNYLSDSGGGRGSAGQGAFPSKAIGPVIDAVGKVADLGEKITTAAFEGVEHQVFETKKPEFQPDDSMGPDELRQMYLEAEKRIREEEKKWKQQVSRCQSDQALLQKLGHTKSTFEKYDDKLEELQLKRGSLGVGNGRQKKQLDNLIEQLKLSKEQATEHLWQQFEISPDEIPEKLATLKVEIEQGRLDEGSVPDSTYLREKQREIERAYKKAYERVGAEKSPQKDLMTLAMGYDRLMIEDVDMKLKKSLETPASPEHSKDFTPTR